MMKIVKNMGVVMLLMIGGVVSSTYASSAPASEEVALTTIERRVYEKAERLGEFVVVLVNTTQKKALEKYLASQLAIDDCCKQVGFASRDAFFGMFGVGGPWDILKRSLISNYLMAFGNIERTVGYLAPCGGLFEKKKEVIDFLVQKCFEYHIILSVEGDDQLEY
ncbi:MAG: hypothetical protein WCJ17_03440 [bacterium]